MVCSQLVFINEGSAEGLVISVQDFHLLNLSKALGELGQKIEKLLHLLAKFTSLDKKSQIVFWLVTHGGKWCVYTKRMFCQNFRIVEKKLAEGSAYLVYNEIYNGKNLKKPKILILGTKTHLYELRCHPHI